MACKGNTRSVHCLIYVDSTNSGKDTPGGSASTIWAFTKGTATKITLSFGDPSFKCYDCVISVIVTPNVDCGSGQSNLKM